MLFRSRVTLTRNLSVVYFLGQWRIAQHFCEILIKEDWLYLIIWLLSDENTFRQPLEKVLHCLLHFVLLDPLSVLVLSVEMLHIVLVYKDHRTNH